MCVHTYVSCGCVCRRLHGESATENSLFLKSEDRHRLGPTAGLWGRRRPCVPASHSGRCWAWGPKPVEGCPQLGLPPPADYPVHCGDACTLPQHEAGRSPGEPSLGVSSLQEALPGRRRSARSTCPPHPRPVPGRGTCGLAAAERECGYQQFSMQRRSPRLRSPSSPGAGGLPLKVSCCKGEGLLGNKAQTDSRPWELPSWWGAINSNTVNTNPSAALLPGGGREPQGEAVQP